MNKHGGYYGDKNEKIIDFSVNINPLGISSNVENKIFDLVKEIHSYPEIEGKSCKKILGDSLNIDSSQIILGNGAIELIYLFANALKPQKVLIIQPTFNEYKRAFELCNSEVIEFITDYYDDFKIDINKLNLYIDKYKPNVVVFCNPNNPTGRYLDKEKFILIMEKIKKINSFLFIDESFIEFTGYDGYINLIENNQIFILRSMTKYYGIPGLRLGFGISNKKIIDRLNKYKIPWTVNSLSLGIAETLLNDREYIDATKEWYRNEKTFLYKNLKEIDYIKVYESDTNFFLCKLINCSSFELNRYLLSKKIYIRTCEDFIGLDDTFIRIGIKKHHENKKLIEALNDFKII